MLAQLAIDADKGSHGIAMSRATDPEARFIASPLPTVDKAAQTLHKAQEAYYKQWPDADRSADLWSVEEVTDP
jgi:hypothetical protein